MIREQLEERGRVAFVADGALPARASGIDERPRRDGMEVAFAALGALVDPRNRDSESNTHAVEIAQRWQAHADADPDADTEGDAEEPPFDPTDTDAILADRTVDVWLYVAPAADGESAVSTA